MTLQFERPGKPASTATAESDSEVETETESTVSNPGRDLTFHSHDSKGRFNHSHPDGDRPHTGHSEDGSPIFEVPEPEVEEEGDCPKEPHLHATLNRRLGMTFPLMDFGHQVVTGKGPWSLFSHCPKCGKLVEDKRGRHFRCDGKGCDARWAVPRDQMKAARELVMHSPEGEEQVMLTAGDEPG